MKAATHTEIYRPFKGRLLARPMRALVLAWSGVRLGFRKKLPALLLFAVPVITTITVAFVINLKFDAKNMLDDAFAQGITDVETEGDPMTQVRISAAQSLARANSDRVAMMVSSTIADVEALVYGFINQMSFFVILVMGWYGAGLIAEDKRLRANLLYFARPITRWTYLRGKLGTAVFWGACVVMAPTTILLSTACFVSPEYQFLKESWPAILKFEGYTLAYVLVHALLVLAISSLADRRNRALAGVFGVYLLTYLGGESMTRMFDGQGWRLMSLPRNFQRVAESMFDLQSGAVDWPLEASIWMIGLYVVVSLAVLSTQLGRMERGA
ncbi:MAG: ABC transporter permease subunit [Planctomycetota bacterium]